jgi:cell division protein FtsA
MMKAVPSLGRGQGRILGGSGSRIVAALDIGSTKTACLIAEWTPDKKSAEIDTRNGLKIIGFGQTGSRGVRNGTITDVAEAERTIRIAVDAAERMAGTTIKSVQVNVSGGKPSTILTRAAVNTANGIVSAFDTDAAVSASLAQISIGKRHVLHLLPCSFYLDGVEVPNAPLGMHGDVLSADIAVVTMDAAARRNLQIAVERCHLAVSGTTLTPFASGRSVLAADEMTLGTVLLDMGGSTSSIAVFKNGKLCGSAVVPLGGQHITSDIAQGLSTTLAHAERLKTLFGSVMGSGHDDRELLAVPLLGERGVDTVQKIPKHVLTSIITPRLDEIFDHLCHHLQSDALGVGLYARVVVTGGASQLHGLREYASSRLNLPVRIGAPTGFQGLPDTARTSGFAAVSGLLVSAANPESVYDMPDEAQVAINRSQMTYAKRVGKWLAEAL